MPAPSIDELKKLIRKVEFNKTEPELLADLVDKAIRAGWGERERLKHINERSYELFESLKGIRLIRQLRADNELINELKKIPIGAVDGSFQVVGGAGGRWHIIFGISQVIAENGFTLNPDIKVDGSIESLEAIDEADAYRKSTLIMMLGETKAYRKVAQRLGSKSGSYLLIDGPIIDPPLYKNKRYVDERVDALKYCYEEGVNVVGFVKRIMGSNYLNFLKKEFKKDEIAEFTNDLDLLKTVMFLASKDAVCPVYTRPISYSEGMEGPDPISPVYKLYNEKGLTIYYSYYKPTIRGTVYRVEYASFKEMGEGEVADRMHKTLSLISQVWTSQGMSEPLLIMIAHNKCSVRRGAAETLYYEIMTRALTEGGVQPLEFS